MEERIKFKSTHRFKGVLFNWHNDPICGEHYEMQIFDNEGNEIFHGYNATPKTLEELKRVVLDCQREIEIERHNQKQREKGWKQDEIIKKSEEIKQAKAIFKDLKKHYGRYVVQYRAGEKWKVVFKNNEPLYFETQIEARKYMEKLKEAHPDMKFKARKWMAGNWRQFAQGD